MQRIWFMVPAGRPRRRERRWPVSRYVTRSGRFAC